MVEANLLVTYDSGSRREARLELAGALKELGEEEPLLLPSGARGVFLVHIHGEPKEATGRLEALCREDPSRFWYTYHWVPIERWCPSTIEEMAPVVKELATKIGPEESWRIRLNKRFFHRYHTRELIEMLARYIENPKVDLERPDKVVWIEIIGRRAGLSILKPSEHFSVNKVKRELLASGN